MARVPLLAYEENLGRAAQLLLIAQPALSRQIQQLERRLGVFLFVRGAHGARLTDAGRLLVPEVERALTQNRRVVRMARAHAAGPERPLTVAAPMPSPSGGPLAEAIREYRSGRPEARLAVVELDDPEQEQALLDGRIDVALTWGLPESDELRAEVVVGEPTTALFAADHPLAGGADVKLRALADEPLLFPVEERHHCWTQLREAAEAEGVELHPIPTAPSAVADLVADGLGVSAVPASFRLAGRPDLAAGSIPGLIGQMSVMWRAGEHPGAATDFVNACRTAASVLTATHPDVWLSPAL